MVIFRKVPGKLNRFRKIVITEYEIVFAVFIM
jgi:hypothetical protein